MILLRHFTEKNQAAVVDIRTRKRKTGESQHCWEFCPWTQVQKNRSVTVLFGLMSVWELVLDQFWLVLIGFWGRIHVVCKSRCPVVWCCAANMKLTPWVLFFCSSVKDYQLIQCQDSDAVGLTEKREGFHKTLFGRYLSNFTSIISQLLQANQDNGSHDAVEASWVLSLALKGLYNTLKVLALILHSLKICSLF